MHADRRGRAVIDVDALVQRLERELRFVSRRGEARRRAAAGTGDAVQVDVVRHLVVRMVLQMELDRVALAHADEAAGHGAAEGPERVAHALGDLLLDLADFEFDDHLGRMSAVRRRRHVRGRGQHRVYGRSDRGTLIPFHRGRGGGACDVRPAQACERPENERCCPQPPFNIHY